MAVICADGLGSRVRNQPARRSALGGLCGEDGGADAVEEGAAVGEVLDRAGEVGVEDGVACAAGPGPLRLEVGLEARVWNRPWRSLGHSRQRLTSFFSLSWSGDLSCGAVREWSEQPSAPDESPWKKIAVAEIQSSPS